MKSAIHRDGYDELATYMDDHVAMGHLMLRVTPESKYDKQPLKSYCGRYVLVGHFRLDYRDELGDKLELTQKQLDNTPDSLLVMKAYQKWRDNCVHHLEGDWAFIIFDYRSDSISCLKDKYGNSSLCYAKQDGLIYYSSSVEIFNDIPSISTSIETSQLVRLSIAGLGIEKNRTILKNVYRVSPCTVITIDSALNENQFIYYEVDKVFEKKFKFQFDYEIDFRSCLAIAVKNRIKGVENLGISVSSGLDSNAILYFASKEVEFNARKIFTYTNCNAHKDSFEEKLHKYISDEIYLTPLLNGKPNIVSNFLSIKETDFKSEFIDSIKEFDNPIVTKNKNWVKSILAKSKNDKIHVLLTGQLGNFTITWNAPNLLITKLLKGDLAYILEQFLFISKSSGISLIKLSWYHLCVPVIKKLKYDFFYLIGLQRKDLIKQSIFKKKYLVKWVRKSDYKIKSSLLYFPSIIDSSKLHKKSFQFNADVSGERWFSAGFDKGVITADPTADNRLVDFIFSLPSNFFYKNGCQKFLFRRMLNGRVDGSILNNDFIIHQSFDLPIKMLNDRFIIDFINSIINDSNMAEIFDIDSISKSYQMLKSIKSPHLRYRESVKLLNDLSIVYLYSKFNGHKSNKI
jgi:asparagine synthase (glutamine-hydrolysing)